MSSRPVENNKNIQRLKTRDEFTKILRGGKRLRFKNWLVINLQFHSKNKIQVGWTVPGYVGTAVVRNRLKRWLKDYLANHWQIDEKLHEGCILHFYFQKHEKSFYRDMDRKSFNQTLSLGLLDVETKARARN